MVNVFFRPVEKINAVLETYPKGIAGFKRYTELLDTEPDVTDAPDAVDVGHLRGDIAFENVTFGYDAHKKVLTEGIDLHLRAGETVAFVGPSGAGKTTLCSLLPRFYDLDAGRITVDGIDIRHMTLASLRQNIGIVQQDVFLFAGTIRENIAYGRLRRERRGHLGSRPPRPTRRHDRAVTEWLWQPLSANAASSYRAGRSSAWRSPACSSKTRPS